MVKELKSARLLNPGWCVTALQHISAFVVNTLQAPNAPYAMISDRLRGGIQ